MENSEDPNRSLFTRPLPLQNETTLFILASSLDVFMTWIAIYSTADFTYGINESNPVAAYFLNRWGAKGLVGFKFAVVAFVCVITQLIALKDEKPAKYVLNLGSIIVALVVLYSFSLWLQFQ